jgi:hypothetical protein
MTWGEFKQFVESNGVTDDDEIRYIDSYCHGPDEMDVIRTEEGLIEIS